MTKRQSTGHPRDTRKSFEARAERFRPRPGTRIDVEGRDGKKVVLLGRLGDISRSGFRCLVSDADTAPRTGQRLVSVRFTAAGDIFKALGAIVLRVEAARLDTFETGMGILAVAFDAPADALVRELRAHLVHAPYVTDELRDDGIGALVPSVDAGDQTILDFYRVDSPDLFAKCKAFHGLVRELQQKRFYQALYRVTLTSGLDHRISVFNPIRRTEEQMICFDSNSYLGLHLHPRVCTAVKRAIDNVGYGTPSAQLLCGTNRYLRELEETLSFFHGREDTVVFPTGYSANVGALTALVRENDLVVRDRFSHASIHDGARATTSRFRRAFPHDDIEALDQILTEASESREVQGKLIVTDGVFSMHGRVARLPELVNIARQHGAKLLVDEAHSTGVIGPTGRGIEELFALPGSIDILVGTFSKAPGAMGGYVSGSRELAYYLRFYATTAMFTAALPAATCAGITQAYRVMVDEPEHRERLWKNVRAFVPAMHDAGLIVPEEMQSPIVTVFMGSSKLLWRFSRDLFDGGIKCGNVAFPAVPMGEAIVRLAVNARHTDEDLTRTVELFAALGKKYGILHRTPDEILEIGERLKLDAPQEGA